MNLNGFSAWVCIEGKEAPEYDVEISEADKTVTCWIASELGKKFSVHWKNSSVSGGTVGELKMDGTNCGGKLMEFPSTASKTGFTDGTTLKPFMFSSLTLTDDDTYLGGNSLPDLGVIELVIYPAYVPKTRPSYRPAAPCALSALKVHERSKKAVTQQISFAQAERLAKPINFVSPKRTGPDLVKFLFKYRPIDILRANGIAPLLAQPKPLTPAPLSEASTPAPPSEAIKRVKKENKPLIKPEPEAGQSKKWAGVKREASDVIDLTQDSSRGKRKKLEGFIQGEVIDLT
ncbi:hypothetical protein B0H12DRAFT_1045718 [Mycena haematopus]|nr:hypothetical protein B0H12DRAFT_1045718 [Mycena haematopus]